MKKYHGWIFLEKEPGMKDHFSAEWRDPQGKSQVKYFGQGGKSAAAAVDHFEKDMRLGPIKLESTPIGLRVFTEVTE